MKTRRNVPQEKYAIYLFACARIPPSAHDTLFCRIAIDPGSGKRLPERIALCFAEWPLTQAQANLVSSNSQCETLRILVS